jgi:hypothetical protein
MAFKIQREQKAINKKGTKNISNLKMETFPQSKKIYR